MKECAWNECSVTFTPRTHNQIYCSDECCRAATNHKIMQRYYHKKAKRDGKFKTCSACGRETLSRFSDDEVCSECKSDKEKQVIASIKNRMANVVWD